MRATNLLRCLAALATTLGLMAGHAAAQSAVGGANLSDSLAAVNQLTPQITEALDATHWQRWKLKGEEKQADDRALTSLHNDLDHVLPGLLSTAQGSPTSLSAGLAVYRNVNALYNVLLRLEQTAELIAKEDAPPLQDVLGRLEIARNTLGDRLVTLAQEQEAALAQARAALAAQAQAAEHPKHVVADDAAPAKKKAASKPASSKTLTSKPANKKPAAATPTE